MPRSQTKLGRKRGPLYVVHPPTYANLEPDVRNRPAVKALVIAYMQRGPCTMTEALDYTQTLPDPIPTGTVRWWDSRLKKLGVIRGSEVPASPIPRPAPGPEPIIRDIEATVKAYRDASALAASRLFKPVSLETRLGEILRPCVDRIRLLASQGRLVLPPSLDFMTWCDRHAPRPPARKPLTWTPEAAETSDAMKNAQDELMKLSYQLLNQQMQFEQTLEGRIAMNYSKLAFDWLHEVRDYLVGLAAQ